MSSQTTVASDWLLQLLVYAAMYRAQGVEVQRVGIFNTLQGTLYLADIGGWDKGADLLAVLQERM